VPQAGLPLETLRVAGLKGKGGGDAYEKSGDARSAMLNARRVLRKHKPVAAFESVATLLGRCFWRLGLGECRIVIFEPNAEAGFTNKVLARLSKRIATGYEISAQIWGQKAIVTGCPCGRSFFRLRRELWRSHLSADYRRQSGRAADQSGFCGCNGRPGGAQE